MFIFAKLWLYPYAVSIVTGIHDGDHQNVSEMRLRLWTAGTNGPIFHPPIWYMSMENHGGVVLTGKHSWFVHNNFLAMLPAVI
jgi:hypothetical protein